MGMIGHFIALKDEDLQALIESPARLNKLRGRPAPEREPSWLDRFLRRKRQSAVRTDSWTPTEPPDSFDVDKAWHGIHFLLTGSARKGTGPRAFILHGGRRIKEDFGYGPARGFSSSEVKQIAHELEQIDINALYVQAEPALLSAEDIYPNVWHDEPKEECLGYLIEYLKELIMFVTKAAQANRALVAYLS